MPEPRGPDIFGIDEPAVPLVRQAYGPGRTAFPPAVEPTVAPSVPGVDVDSQGRSWADVKGIDPTTGEVVTTRRELSPDEVEARRAAATPPPPAEPTALDPGAPAGPSVVDDRMQQGRQLADVTSDPLWDVLGARTPVRYVENQKKNDLEAFGEAYYGGNFGGGISIEEIARDAGININPPAPFDPDAAAASFEPPMRLESETREEYTERVRALAQQHVKIAELEHGAMEADYAADMDELQRIYDEELRTVGRDMGMIAEDGGPNIFQAQQIGHTWRTEAEQTQLNTAASRLEQTAHEMRDATAEIRQQEEARQARVEAQFQAAQTVQSTLRAARQRLEAQPDPDAGRYFKSMSGGQKFLAILGGVLTGWNGSPMVPHMLLQLAEKDLESQKATIAKRQAEVGAAEAEHAGQMNIYRYIMSQVQDERTADLMMLGLQMEDAERLFSAEMARTTVDVHKAAMYQIMVGIKEQQNKLFYELQSRIHAMPDKIAVGGRSPYTKEQLAVAAAQLKAQGAEGVKQIGGAIEMPGEWQFEAAKMQHELDRDAAKDARKAQGEVDADVSKIDAAIANVEELERKYATPGGIDLPGQAGSWENPFAGSEAQAARAQIALTIRMIGKAIEDDRFSDADAKAYAEAIRGDWRTTNDNELMSRLVEGKKILQKLRGRRPARAAVETPGDFQED